MLQARGSEIYPSVQLNIFDEDVIGATLEEQLACCSDTWASASLRGFDIEDVLQDIQAPQAWERTLGQGTTIAVVDSGVSPNLRAISGARRCNVDVSDVFQDKQWVDDRGHGSMCAAIAAGSQRDGGKYSGVAPEAAILSARTSFESDDLFVIYDNLLAARQGGELAGPLVVSGSFGFHSCAPPDLRPVMPLIAVIQQLTEAGVPCVFAAGNNHTGKCGYPPTAYEPPTIWGMNALECVLTVGAVGKMGEVFTNQHRYCAGHGLIDCKEAVAKV